MLSRLKTIILPQFMAILHVKNRYKLGTYLYILVCSICTVVYWYILVHTSIYWYILVCTKNPDFVLLVQIPDVYMFFTRGTGDKTVVLAVLPSPACQWFTVTRRIPTRQPARPVRRRIIRVGDPDADDSESGTRSCAGRAARRHRDRDAGRPSRPDRLASASVGDSLA
jgi:hypothetical protein